MARSKKTKEGFSVEVDGVPIDPGQIQVIWSQSHSPKAEDFKPSLTKAFGNAGSHIVASVGCFVVGGYSMADFNNKFGLAFPIINFLLGIAAGGWAARKFKNSIKEQRTEFLQIEP